MKIVGFSGLQPVTYYLIEKQITSAIQLLNPLGVRFIPLAVKLHFIKTLESTSIQITK